jgi:hypothetical protein
MAAHIGLSSKQENIDLQGAKDNYPVVWVNEMDKAVKRSVIGKGNG